MKPSLRCVCSTRREQPPSPPHRNGPLRLVAPLPVFSQPRPESLRVLSVAEPLEICLRLLLGHLPTGDGPIHASLCMTSTDHTNRSVEFIGALGGAEACRFFFSDTA